MLLQIDLVFLKNKINMLTRILLKQSKFKLLFFKKIIYKSILIFTAI